MAGQRKGDSDEEAGDQLLADDAAYRDSDREPADHQGLCLGAHGIGQVHDSRQEEGQDEVHPELVLEGGDEIGGEEHAQEAHDEPGQPVRQAPPHRLLQRAPGGQCVALHAP